jgi:hypothetical protein
VDQSLVLQRTVSPQKSDTFCSVHPTAAPLVTVSCASKRLVVQEAFMGGRSSPKILYPEWQHEYQAALLEIDRKKL